MKKIFVTGIGTDVGKTIASAILVEALQADYWKPVQAGELEATDQHKVEALVSNKKSKFHSSSYSLKTAMSPHAAAIIDKVTIDIKKLGVPKTKNHLIIEGAGGLLVPLNKQHTILDIIDPMYKVVVVSRHYLGSINHTLLTLNILKDKGFQTALIFSGDEHPTTESIIKKMTSVPVLGRIEEEPYFDKNIVVQYANDFYSAVQNL